MSEEFGITDEQLLDSIRRRISHLEGEAGRYASYRALERVCWEKIEELTRLAKVLFGEGVDLHWPPHHPRSKD